MNLGQIIELDKKYYMNTFGDRVPVCFTRGEGMFLYDTEGKRYRDFFAGIAVSSLGHSHPKFIAALKEQLDRVIHTSSVYYIENQARLAQMLALNSCADRVFFASTGAEANEGAVKLAKMYFYKKGKDKTDVITLVDSFHGRTLAMVAATGQKKYQKPYRPLAPGFYHVPINDIEALKKAITPKTAAIMLEVIQGESGVHPACNDYLKQVRKLCDERQILLIFDEVQTGIGRTGALFAYQTTGVEPDIFTLAKGLGGGIPISAVCAKEEFCAFSPGDHGTTFGGNPFSTAAGIAVLNIIFEEKLIENAKNMGEYFAKRLSELKCKEVRARGLMIGAELYGDAKAVQRAMFEKGFLVGSVGNTLRILPPLIVKKEDIDEFIEALKEVIGR